MKFGIKKTYLALLFLCIFSSTTISGSAAQLDLSGAAQGTDFSDDKFRWSLNLKLRYSNFSNYLWGLGLIGYAGFHHNLVGPNVGLGLGKRFGKSTYFDIGAGVYMTGLSEPGPFITWVFGTHLGSGWYFSVPFTYEMFHNGPFAARWGPFFGYRF